MVVEGNHERDQPLTGDRYQDQAWDSGDACQHSIMICNSDMLRFCGSCQEGLPSLSLPTVLELC